MICKKCNAQNDDDSLFCKECGAEIKEVDSPDEKSNETVLESTEAGVVEIGSKRDFKKIALIAGAAIVVISGAVFAYTSTPGFKANNNPAGFVASALEKSMKNVNAEGKESVKLILSASDGSNSTTFGLDVSGKAKKFDGDFDTSIKFTMKNEDESETSSFNTKIYTSQKGMYVKIPNTEKYLNMEYDALQGTTNNDVASVAQLEEVSKIMKLMAMSMKNTFSKAKITSEDKSIDIFGESKKTHKISMVIDNGFMKNMSLDIVNNLFSNAEFIAAIKKSMANEEANAQIDGMLQQLKDPSVKSQIEPGLNQLFTMVTLKDSKVVFYIDDQLNILGTDIDFNLNANIGAPMEFKMNLKSLMNYEKVDIKIPGDVTENSVTMDELEKDEKLQKEFQKQFAPILNAVPGM